MTGRRCGGDAALTGRSGCGLPARGGLTLVELLCVIATLVILLGVLVSLARYVRGQSAEQLMRAVLSDLDRMLVAYVERFGQPPSVPPVLPDGEFDVPQGLLLERMIDNNRAWVPALRSAALLLGRDARDPLASLPVWLYDERTLLDPWGMPLVLVTTAHPALGMAPADEPFILSGGPDRQILTRRDNFYSYEARGDW